MDDPGRFDRLKQHISNLREKKTRVLEMKAARRNSIASG